MRIAVVILSGAVRETSVARAQSPDRPLTLGRREAVDSALVRNPQLQVAIAQIYQARARVTQATAFPDPSFSADVSGLSAVTRPGSGTGSNFGIGLSVPFLTKFSLRATIGNADVRAAEFNLEQLRQLTASQTVQAYDALLVAGRHRVDLEEVRTLAADFLRKTRVAFESGSVARLDVIKAQVAFAQVENDLIANERDLANARAGLNRLMGRGLGAAVEAADSLTVPPSPADLDELLARARDARPELRAIASQRRGAAASTSLARAFWLPDLGLSLSKNLATGSPSSYTAGVGFSVPLFFWNHSRGEVAESRWRERELSAALSDLEAQVDLDVRTAYAAASTSLRQAVYLRDEVLPEAREAYRIAAVSYGLGGISALDVLDARRTLIEAENAYAEALGAANDARAALELAVGAPLDTQAPGGSHGR